MVFLYQFILCLGIILKLGQFGDFIAGNLCDEGLHWLIYSEGVVHEGAAHLHFLLVDIVANEAPLYEALPDLSKASEESLLEEPETDYLLALVNHQRLSRRQLHNRADSILSSVLNI